MLVDDNIACNDGSPVAPLDPKKESPNDDMRATSGSRGDNVFWTVLRGEVCDWTGAPSCPNTSNACS